jgi:hypothetical protein
MFRELGSSIGRVWCGLMHESLMWPAHGQYECRSCGRRYPAFGAKPDASWARRRAFQPVVSLLIGNNNEGGAQ